MNKKIIAALSLVMLFSAFSCRGNKNPSSEQTSNPPISEVTTSQDSTKEESTSSEEPSEEPSQEVTSEDVTVTPSTEESTEQPSEEQSSELTTETPSTSETPVTSETTSNNPSSNNPSSEDTTTSENTSENSSSTSQGTTIEFVIANKQWDEGLTYITNNEQFPDPSFYSDGGLKMNFVNMGFETKNPLTPSNSVAVTLIVNALNENEKSGTDADAFTIYGLNSNGQVVVEAGLENVEVGENIVTLNGQGIVKVKVVMTDYAHNGNSFCNVSVGGLIVTSSGNGSQGGTSSETPTTSETPSTSETTSNNPSSEDTTTSENTSNNQTSSTPVVNLDPITFGSVTKDADYSVDKIKLPSWVDSVEMVKGFGTGNEEVKLGSSKAIGSLVFKLNEAIDIEKIIIDARQYSSDTGKTESSEIKITLSDGQSKTISVTGSEELVFEFNANSVTSITVESTSNGKRVNISSISVYGEGGQGENQESSSIPTIPESSETPVTSETPSTSEEVSSENTSTTNPSSGTTSEEVSNENTSTNESSSNSSTDDSSSNIVLQDSYVITFNKSNAENDYTSNPSSLLNLQNGITFDSAAKLFSDETNAIRLGSSSSIGNIKFNLDPNVKVTSVIIKGELYNASKDGSVGLEVSLSNNLKENIVVNGEFEEVFTFTSNQESSYLLISTNNEGNKPRVLITEIIVNYAIEGGQDENQESSSIPTIPESSETPSTSEEVSSENTSTTNPSSGTTSEDQSSESSNENTSNNQTSSTPVVNLDPITFDCYASTSDLPVSVANLPSWVSSVEFTKILGQDDTTIKLGSSKVAGKLVFTLTESIDIERIVINGNKYTDSENKLTVTLSDGKTQTLTFDSTGKLVFEFDANNSTTITIEANKRAYITSIEVYAEDGNSGQGGSVVQPTQELLTYSSTKTPTSGKTVAQKVNYTGYYQPVINNSFNIDNYAYYSYVDYLQSTGKSKILVVPVDFTDYRAENKLSGGEEQSQANIYNVFFGESEETGWESVRSFYEKSSYGSLIIEGSVTPWFHSSYSTTSLANLTYSGGYGYDDYYDPTWTLLDEVASWAKNTLNIDLSEYDTDDDGFIDGIWMVYACDENHNENRNLYWAYTYWNYDNYELSYENQNNLYPYVYCWASYNFMFEGGYGLPDAHTYIHETGHMLGLDDYYDVDGTEGVCGGVDMMDNNIGDHGAYSKYLLNWTSPYVIDGTQNSVTINLKPFESSGEFILLGNEFNDSAFDEYITIEYYTPTGLNEKDKNGYAAGLNTYTQAGIKINHIDARIICDHYDENGENITLSEYVNEFNDENASYTIGQSNSPRYSYDLDGNDNNDYRLNHLIEANKNYTFNASNYMDNYGENDVLFHTGDSFSLSTYSNFFVNGATLNNGKTLPYTITIGSVNQDGSITITITK